MNKYLAAILSFFIPGLGQALSGEVQRGIILFIATIVIAAVSIFIFRRWFTNIINLVISIYAAYDAYKLNV